MAAVGGEHRIPVELCNPEVIKDLTGGAGDLGFQRAVISLQNEDPLLHEPAVPLGPGPGPWRWAGWARVAGALERVALLCSGPREGYQLFGTGGLQALGWGAAVSGRHSCSIRLSVPILRTLMPVPSDEETVTEMLGQDSQHTGWVSSEPPATQRSYFLPTAAAGQVAVADHSSPTWRLKGQGDMTHVPPGLAQPIRVAKGFGIWILTDRWSG